MLQDKSVRETGPSGAGLYAIIRNTGDEDALGKRTLTACWPWASRPSGCLNSRGAWWKRKRASSTFSLFDRFLKLAQSEGHVKVILCTPTATPPAWLTDAHPEVLNKARMDGTLIRITATGGTTTTIPKSTASTPEKSSPPSPSATARHLGGGRLADRQRNQLRSATCSTPTPTGRPFSAVPEGRTSRRWTR